MWKIALKTSKSTAEVLIRRGQVLYELGKTAESGTDFLQAAKIMEKDDSQKTKENIEALQKGLMGMSLYKKSTEEESYSIDELVGSVKIYFETQIPNNKLVNEDCKSLDILRRRVFHGEHVSALQFIELVRTYVNFVEALAMNQDNSDKLLGRFKTLSSQFVEILTIQMRENGDKEMIAEVFNTFQKLWDRLSYEIPNEILELCCSQNNTLYSKALEKLFELGDLESKSILETKGYSTFFDKIFYFAMHSAELEQRSNVLRNAVLLAELNEGLAIKAFSNPQTLVNLNSEEYPQRDALKNNKKRSSIKLPAPLSQLLYVCGNFSEKDSRLGWLLLSRLINKEKEIPECMKIAKYAESAIMEWLQSTKQKDKARGYHALAGILSAQSSSILALLANSVSIVQDMFEEAEYDELETRLGLAILSDIAAGIEATRALISCHGTKFLRESIDSAKNGGGEVGVRLANISTTALAKLTGEAMFSGTSGTGVKSAAVPTVEEIKEKSELTPEKLIDILTNNIMKLDMNKPKETDFDVVESTAESLSYLSLQSNQKNIITESKLLAKLVEFVSNSNEKGAVGEKRAATRFAFVSIIRNLVYRKPPISEEQANANRLQKTAMKSQRKAAGIDVEKEEKQKDFDEKTFESQEAIDARCTKLGEMPKLISTVLSSANRNSSDSTIDVVVDIVFSLCCLPKLRGVLVQCGCVLVLTRNTLALSIGKPKNNKNNSGDKRNSGKEKSDSKKTADVDRDFKAAHALAKIAITIPPNLAFPESSSTPASSLIGPFLKLAEHNGFDQLCVFESLMALTNFVGFVDGQSYRSGGNGGGSLADVFSMYDGGKSLKIVDNLLYSSMKMVRRAAVELVCNLVANSEAAFMHFIEHSEDIPAFKSPESSDDNENEPFRAHKLHLLAALSDFEHTNDSLLVDTQVYDSNTILAASGALATLTAHPSAVRFLVCCHPTFLSILENLISSPCYVNANKKNGKNNSNIMLSIGFCHRGLVILMNLANFSSAGSNPDDNGQKLVVFPVKKLENFKSTLKKISSLTFGQREVDSQLSTSIKPLCNHILGLIC
ncbi:hypothetical protein AX774_g58 [Zancudomyces culisetae]|uniref:Uncharacterized protein n=1 Tax=Zancudomyces culisetae TaxID=1213189 RepID=A0A1R1PZK0_ZANCU|nr:hypothetical protein AX774_g58 [Zancudomyces culisetae]|eukprot:OMH86372.1 hypothetical protein AX774_g58 [Zancudomyces culisetae]